MFNDNDELCGTLILSFMPSNVNTPPFSELHVAPFIVATLLFDVLSFQVPDV